MSASNKGPGVDYRLQNLTNALYLDLNNDVVVRTGFAGNIVISGNVNIPGDVTVNSTPENPVHTHITEIGTSGNLLALNIPWMPIYGNVVIDGNANVRLVGNVAGITTLPAITGNVRIHGNIGGSDLPITVNQGTTPWVTTGNANVTVIGNIAGITTLPSITGNVGVSGNVSISQLPGITVTNFPSNVRITDGSISVTNFPAFPSNVSITQMPGITGNVWVNGITGNITGITTLPAITGNVGVSGNVSITQLPAITGNVNVDNFPSNVSITQMPAITGNVNAVFTGTVTTTVVDGQQDAFGRLRVSEAFTLGDYKHTYGIDPNFRDTLTNGGTVTHIANQAAARLATSNNSSSRAIHQTKMYHNYMPGKSQLIKSTINFYAATTNVTKRTGYYDDLNGIYFEQNGNGVLSFVVRTNTSGTASDARRIVQADWNKDKCDGTGASGFNLDITKTQIVFIDFQWLGVGRVRCGFVHDGQMIVAHEFYNSNNLPVVYMSNPNLPVRCEILNTGTSTGGYFDQICSTVVSEGGYVESGIDFSADTGQTSQSITVANGMYPVIAIRLKNSFRGYPNRVVVRSGNINVYAEEYPAYWAVYKLDALANITLSDPTWTSADADSAVEYTLLATAFTGGDRIDGGLVGTTSPGGSAKGTGTAPVNQPSNAKKNFIAQNIDSTDSEIYVVCGKAIGGTTKLWVDFQWREIY
jgi:hypothetical protein